MRTHRVHSVTAFTGILLGTAALARADHQAPYIMALPPIPGSTRGLGGSGISADGAAVVGNGIGASGFGEAFRWTETDGTMGLGTFLPNTVSQARAASNGGAVVVGWSDNDVFGNTYQAFRWTPKEGLMGLGFLPGGNSSDAIRISADGSVIVGWSHSASGVEAFRWKDGQMIGLGDLPGGPFESIATGVSADGAVVVGPGRSFAGSDAWMWTEETGMFPLPGLSDFNTGAAAVSGDGRVVGGTFWPRGGGVFHAYRWSLEDGMLAMPFLPDGTRPINVVGLSWDGSLIVGSTGQGGPYIWDALHGTRYLLDVFVNDYGLDLTGWTMMSVSGVSADGRTFAGGGYYEVSPGEFASRPWIAHIPEPSALSAFSLGLILSMTHARGRPRRGATVAQRTSLTSGGTNDVQETEKHQLDDNLSSGDTVRPAPPCVRR
jgi:probable HAF family extracellular repeat protein